MEQPKYKRVLLKISGEALAGDASRGLDFNVIGDVCDVVKKCVEKGVEVGIVVGGGNSAMQEAILLSEVASEVIIIQNLGEVTGEKSLKTVLDSRENVRFILGAQIRWITEEDGKFTGVVYEDIDGKQMLSADGMFVAIGQVPQCEAFADVVTLNRWGYVEAGESCLPETKIEGVFVAGDCRTKAIRQVTTATADGAVAALAACNFVDMLRLRR